MPDLDLSNRVHKLENCDHAACPSKLEWVQGLSVRMIELAGWSIKSDVINLLVPLGYSRQVKQTPVSL